MNTLKTPEELSTQIEDVVHGYLARVREAAEEAVARAFAGSAATPERMRRAAVRSAKAVSSRRRSTQEMAELQEELEALIRAQPGESMTTFAAKLGMTVRELHRPMTRLRRAGRIRTVGERHLTRYFPAASRTSSAA